MKRKTLLFTIVCLLLMVSPAGSTIFVIVSQPVYEFFQEPGSTSYYWGDVHGDPCSPYPITVDINVPIDSFIEIDPNTGTSGYVSNPDPNYILRDDTPNDPNDYYLWGFKFTMPKKPSIIPYDVQVKASKSDSLNEFGETKIIRIRPLKKPIFPFVGCRSVD